MNESKNLSTIVEEQFCESKTGNPDECEDLVHISEYYIGVIDGFTSKTNRRWNGETGGQAAAKIINKAFNEIPRDCTARQAVDIMTTMIQDSYKKVNAIEDVENDPKQRMAAFFAAISLFRKELWILGDCQALLGEQIVTNHKIVDQVLANVRALRLELEILKGTTIDQLRKNDTGREFIMPLLEEQSRLQNNPPAGEYWYPIIDGFPVPNNGIIIKPIPDNIDSVVLATDGYPILKSSLKDSEDALKEILDKDPLLFRKYKSTKGISKDNVSFDDRAFVKVRLER